jgi:predicted esterase
MSAPDPSLLVAERTLPANTRLYYDVYRPTDSTSPLLIALHGYGANKKQMMREAKQMAPQNFAIVSLQGFYQHIKEPKELGGLLRFGFGWLTNFHPEDSVAIHHQALLALIATLTDEGIAKSNRIFLLGFSQTCALNYRFAFTHPDVLRGVVGICGGIPGDWETGASYQPTKAAVLHLAGTRDEYYPPPRVADYEARLRLRAPNVAFKNHDAAHEIVASMRDDVRAWLIEYSE